VIDVAQRNARRQKLPDVETLALWSRRAAAAQRQRPRREREWKARRHAAAYAASMKAEGCSCCQTARRLHLRPRTLAHWCHRDRQGETTWQPRGRPCKQSTVETRRSVLELIRDTGPNVGIPALRVAFPRTPRCELIDLQRVYRRQYQRQNRLAIEDLTWHSPGRVWAMDHAKPPSPVDGIYPWMFAVRDLASGMQLAWLPVPDETAETTRDALVALFVEHGPPLVLKSDNGSAFKSDLIDGLLEDWRIIPLPSPPVTPQYNGSCEAGIGAMKVATHYRAALAGRSGFWTSEDTEAARRKANEFQYPQGHTQPTNRQVWQSRPPIDYNERTTFHDTVQRIRKELQEALDAESTKEEPTAAEQAAQHRRVVRQALVELGILSTQWRSIPLPIKRKKLARIS
jgi:hypothetical protein